MFFSVSINIAWDLFCPGKGVTVVGVHPPIAYTNLRDKLFTRGRWMKPFVKLSMKTPLQAAQTTIFAAVDQGVVNGKIYQSVELFSPGIDSVTDNEGIQYFDLHCRMVIPGRCLRATVALMMVLKRYQPTVIKQ